jgi:formate-dependent nitrite reductase cytochrome c552 subunit
MLSRDRKQVMNHPAHRYGIMIGLLAVSLLTGCASTTLQKSANLTHSTPTSPEQPILKADTQSPESIAQNDKVTAKEAAIVTVANNEQPVDETSKDDAKANTATLDKDTKRMILSWATHSLLRAQTMMHGSDDVSLIVDAAMDHNEAYRSKLADHLTEQGITDQNHEQAMARIEKHIRTATRDFVLQARTLLKRENKAMPTEQRSDVMI